MSVIIFLTVLSILIVVHEWGHYIAAKKVGVTVEKFSVGFGPKLFSKNFQGTEFMVSAIPLGGFVKLAGDERSQCKGDPREFYSHPVWHRALIVLMGPVINVVFAYLCFYCIFLTGFPMLSTTIGKVMDGYPAAKAELREGDKILQINHVPILGWDDVQKMVRSSNGTMDVVFERNGQELTKVIEPQVSEVPNIFGQKQKLHVIGIQPTEEIVFLKYGPVQSIGKAYQQIVDLTTMTVKSLYYVFVGALPAKDALAGPIRIFDVIKNAADKGLPYLIYIMAVISLSLAIFNLFPIPVLDGGHLFLLAVEKVRGRPLSVKMEEGLTRAGFSLILCLMVFVLYNDVVQVGWVAAVKGFFHKL